MKSGIYAILAVVVGVMLIGMLPGQLSNLVTPPILQKTPLSSGASPESNSNLTVTGSVKSGSGNSNSTGFTTPTRPANSSSNATTTPASPASTQDAKTKTDSSTTSYHDTASPYADLGYYSLWGVGLIAAITVYFVSKKILV